MPQSLPMIKRHQCKNRSGNNMNWTTAYTSFQRRRSAFSFSRWGWANVHCYVWLMIGIKWCHVYYWWYGACLNLIDSLYARFLPRYSLTWFFFCYCEWLIVADTHGLYHLSYFCRCRSYIMMQFIYVHIIIPNHTKCMTKFNLMAVVSRLLYKREWYKYIYLLVRCTEVSPMVY